MRQLLFLLLLVPLHLASGALVAWLVFNFTDLDVVASQWVIVPLYVLLAAALSTGYLARFVIAQGDKTEFFNIKVMLGSVIWASFLIWAKLLVIYQGYMTPVETDFISAALLVFGTALMIQYFWTRPKA